MNPLKLPPAVKLLETAVEALNMDLTLKRVARELETRRKGYICMANVHGIMEAHRDQELAAIYAGSLMTVPDGMPIVWVGRWQGRRKIQRVAGPDLMLEVFRRKEFAGYTHFLYGGEEHVADELRDRFSRRYPWAQIVGTCTPPFRDLNAEEERSLIARVRELKPDIIWVGISTPKQERFMHRYLRLLDTTLMFGVGAAYDFHTDRIQDAPQWVKTIGMQWLHRLLQDPRRLWKRYLLNNPAFLWHIALQLSGLRSYSSAQREYLPVPLDTGRPRQPDALVGQLAKPTAHLQRLGS
jgi:N-acetylglucosaminyldiphosphoundecaprenol N-acetyl-beta-D-mannosaminyltransferase